MQQTISDSKVFERSLHELVKLGKISLETALRECDDAGNRRRMRLGAIFPAAVGDANWNVAAIDLGKRSARRLRSRANYCQSVQTSVAGMVTDISPKVRERLRRTLAAATVACLLLGSLPPAEPFCGSPTSSGIGRSAPPDAHKRRYSRRSVECRVLGSLEDLHLAMLAAGWFPADPITLKTRRKSWRGRFSPFLRRRASRAI